MNPLRLQLRFLVPLLATLGLAACLALAEAIADAMVEADTAKLQPMIDRAAKDERIVGIGLCTREGALDRRTEAYPAALPCDRARTVADSAPPMLAIGGKCCVNLVLAGASTKGHAVEALVACTGAAGVLFMGDDVTDESVYRMSRPSWLTIHVGRTEHVTGASFYVDTQRDVAGVLRRLVDLTHTLSR